MMPVLAGFTLGCMHAFDVDHIVAVTAFTSKNPDARKPAWLGILWGVGHTTTLLVVGLVSLLFKLIIPPLVESIAEVAIGALLIAIGVWVLADLLRHKHMHIHKHLHDGVEHIHFHSHQQGEGHNHKHSIFFVGAAHGFAGTASVLVIIPITITQSILAASLYLLLFGVGTIVAMAGFAYVLGRLTHLARIRQLVPIFRWIAGSVSVLVGILWIGLKVF